MIGQLRKATFTIDSLDGENFSGFTLGGNWNGWACPYFTFEQARRIVEAHRSKGQKAWYDEARDVFAQAPTERILVRRLLDLGRNNRGGVMWRRVMTHSPPNNVASG